MRLLCIADVHDAYPGLGFLKGCSADLMVIAGDLHDDGTPEDAAYVLDELSRFPQMKLIVPGNMDPRSFAEALWRRHGLIPIHRSSFLLGNVGFVGMGGMVARNPRRIGDPTRYYHSDEDLYRTLTDLLQSIRDLEQRVVVVHQPPRGVRDRLYNGELSGSVGLRRVIEEHQPDLVVCGHIHEDRGASWLGGTLVVNVGEARMGYAALIDLDGMDVEWLRAE
ncbi:MAG: metallophosphoesterase [Methanothrix sp.]|uniref:metallophosphoesterase family protein n=1 Tax=Methanothrix sp. TaxID=90426 RepID=UPI0025F24B78|nr:metallophosphoesterase [Methanothrix sp.]MCQ8903178.1 metallophosphoesterase [Methanothrix sp.]